MQNTQADISIRIEIKPFNNEVIFILHRGQNQIIDFNNKKNLINANINIPVAYNLINSKDFNKFATDLKLINNRQTISFKVSDELQFKNKINGKKFDACYVSHNKILDKNLSSLGSVNNGPGGIKYFTVEKDHDLSFN